MSALTKQAFAERMVVMAEMWGYEFPTDENGKSPQMALYYERLRHLGERVFNDACNQLIDSFRPTSTVKFPVVSDFIRAVGMDDDSLAANVVASVKRAAEEEGQYKSVVFGDGAVHATIKSYGGWPTVARWGYEEWKFQERKFRETYLSLRRSREPGPKYLPGIIELENSSRHDGGKFIDPPVPVTVPGLPPPQRPMLEDRREDEEEIGDVDGVISDIIKRLESREADE